MNQWQSFIDRGAEYISTCTGQPVSAGRVIAQSELRCVVEFASLTHRYVGKFYTDDSGRKAQAAMQAAVQAAHSAAAPLAVPPALFYADSLRMLVMPFIDLPNYSELSTHTRFPDMLAQAGRALAQLHTHTAIRAEVNDGDSSYINILAELMNPHPLVLAQQLPEQREGIVALLSAQHGRAQNNPDPITRLHRDFHLRQMFYALDQTWLIDWDLSDWGEAALDVGNFLVYLRTHLPAAQVASCSAAFLDGYFSGNTISSDRIQLYASITYLRLACKHYRRQAANWRTSVNEMLAASATELNLSVRQFA